MVKIFGGLLLAFLPAICSGQVFTEQGLIRAAASISPSFSLGTGKDNVYLNGDAEYFFSPKTSLRADIYGLVGTLETSQYYRHDHHLIIGPQWHKSIRNIDLFTGLQMGVSATQPVGDRPLLVSPNLSVIAGVTFYVHDYFNFFLHTRYMNHRYQGEPSGGSNLDEITICGGLGFQFKTRKITSK